MKFFTPELYVRLQQTDGGAMDAADAEWDAAAANYDRQLAALRDKLPVSALKLLDAPGLHDAEVLWMGQAGPFFAILLKLDLPPQSTLLLTYRTVCKVDLNHNSFPAEFRSSQMQWLYDEIDVGGEAGSFRHSILFSSGVELKIEASEVQSAVVDTFYSPLAPSKVPA